MTPRQMLSKARLAQVAPPMRHLDVKLSDRHISYLSALMHEQQWRLTQALAHIIDHYIDATRLEP